MVTATDAQMPRANLFLMLPVVRPVTTGAQESPTEAEARYRLGLQYL